MVVAAPHTITHSSCLGTGSSHTQSPALPCTLPEDIRPCCPTHQAHSGGWEAACRARVLQLSFLPGGRGESCGASLRAKGSSAANPRPGHCGTGTVPEPALGITGQLRTPRRHRPGRIRAKEEEAAAQSSFRMRGRRRSLRLPVCLGRAPSALSCRVRASEGERGESEEEEDARAQKALPRGRHQPPPVRTSLQASSGSRPALNPLLRGFSHSLSCFTLPLLWQPGDGKATQRRTPVQSQLQRPTKGLNGCRGAGMYLSHTPAPPTCSSVPNVTRSASSAEHECKAKQGSCTGGREDAARWKEQNTSVLIQPHLHRVLR
ncbi:uncharacterized protein PRD47_017790 [Ara ararauna]